VVTAGKTRPALPRFLCEAARLDQAATHRREVEEERSWGAVEEKDSVLRGENRLGRLLVELRDEAEHLRAAGREAELLRVEPPAIPDFLLLGEPIGVVEADSGARV
jgi:hypothetical protein